MEIFINVILPIPLEKHFTYRISEYQASKLKLGMRVAVPFGKSKLYTALVVELHNRPPLVYEAKAIHDILDEEPIVTSIQLKHWQWIADYYMCTLGEVFRSAIPSALLLESETLILLNKDVIIDEDQLKDDEFLVYEALKYQNILRVNDVMEIVEKKNILPILNRLIKIKAIVLKEEIHEQYKPKMVRYVRLGQRYNKEAELEKLLDSLTRAPKQSQVV
ncbi:MAG: primosomal protein N', partial [Eudoraea sp.]